MYFMQEEKKCEGGTYINTLLTDLVLPVPKALKWLSEGICSKVFMTDMMCSSICGTKVTRVANVHLQLDLSISGMCSSFQTFTLLKHSGL